MSDNTEEKKTSVEAAAEKIAEDTNVEVSNVAVQEAKEGQNVIGSIPKKSAPRKSNIVNNEDNVFKSNAADAALKKIVVEEGPLQAKPVVENKPVVVEEKPAVVEEAKPVLAEEKPKDNKAPIATNQKPGKTALWSNKNIRWTGVGALTKGYNIVSEEASKKWLTRQGVRNATPEEVATYFEA